ncbi:tRNA (guanine(10)-N(2))-dimethyltransferase [Thermococcus gorgonarius]|uniref:tRNA (guanine(26)-N(2))-dimethyltransferase n=1 Tax=Thermococcus gorgonarius TaxID=71997 RepID=A0A2Z2MET0_THEGO|nr:tRNA (guanine(10)-N(2))-dimethyltransferase [Thermococcus gorgonarius]ASJ00508.1 tRNA (guanine(10)-N(2))-dimethyltransferase [Thermococcus gorgonarius]
MELKEVREGASRFFVPEAERIYDAPVFYNPVMAINRDISVLAVDVLKPSRVLDALSATGVRGLRYLLETPAGEVWMNDIKEEAFRLILRNVELNGGKIVKSSNERVVFDISGKKAIVSKGDANRLMAEKFRYFDFIDLDPFGAPVEFLDTALRAVKRRGFLGVTATDTGVLCGAYRNACLRKYLAVPIRGELCHEAGLRILIGLVARYAAKYDLGVKVLLAYYRDHYFRVFLGLKSGARKADESLSNIGYLWQDKSGKFWYSREFLPSESNAYGPLWLGELKDDDFMNSLLKKSQEVVLASNKTLEFIRLLSDELDVPFHYDTHAIARRHGLEVRKLAVIMEKLEKMGYRVTRTHFSPTSIKTDAPFDAVLDALRGL